MEKEQLNGIEKILFSHRKLFKNIDTSDGTFLYSKLLFGLNNKDTFETTYPK